MVGKPWQELDNNCILTTCLDVSADLFDTMLVHLVHLALFVHGPLGQGKGPKIIVVPLTAYFGSNGHPQIYAIVCILKFCYFSVK